MCTTLPDSSAVAVHGSPEQPGARGWRGAVAVPQCWGLSQHHAPGAAAMAECSPGSAGGLGTNRPRSEGEAARPVPKARGAAVPCAHPSGLVQLPQGRSVGSQVPEQGWQLADCSSSRDSLCVSLHVQCSSSPLSYYSGIRPKLN